jgi:hypothetical protein
MFQSLEFSVPNVVSYEFLCSSPSKAIRGLFLIIIIIILFIIVILIIAIHSFSYVFISWCLFIRLFIYIFTGVSHIKVSI